MLAMNCMRNKMKKSPLLLSAIITLILLAISCSSGLFGRSYSSNGEMIYFTSQSNSGSTITYTGGIRMMHTISCVDCHATDGKGGSIHIMMTSFDAPNITWAELTGQHENHAPYTETTIKDAITEEIEPNGEPLDELMPRWQMSDSDMDDLMDFIKTLE